MSGLSLSYNPLNGEVPMGASSNNQDGAHLNIVANGFWGGRFQCTFCDLRVFNPHVPSNRQGSIASVYQKHEQIKKRAYEQIICEVEHFSFTSIELSTATGGMSTEATTFHKRLAALLLERWDQSYANTMAWLRCHVTFNLH